MGLNMEIFNNYDVNGVILDLSEIQIQNSFCPKYLSESPKLMRFFVRNFLSEIKMSES